MVRIAPQAGDARRVEGPVEAEQSAVSGPRLGEVERGDEGALGALGHERAVESGASRASASRAKAPAPADWPRKSVNSWPQVVATTISAPAGI